MDENTNNVQPERGAPPEAPLRTAVIGPPGVPLYPNPIQLFQFQQYYQQQNHPAVPNSGRNSAPTVPAPAGAFPNPMPALPVVPPAMAPPIPPPSARGTVKPTPKDARKGKKKVKSNQKIVKGGGNSKYTKEELTLLLDAIERTCPIGQIAWTTVKNEFNSHVGEERERDEKSLRNRFAALYQTKVPTGNPNIPPLIKRAKEIQDKIEERSEMVNAANMSSDDGYVEGEEEDEEGEEEEEDVQLEGGLGGAVVVDTANSSVTTSNTGTKRKQKSKAGRQEKKKKKKKATSKSETTSNRDVIDVILQLDKSERERERRREKRESKNMKVFLGLMATYVGSKSGADTSEVIKLITAKDSSSEEEEEEDEVEEEESLSSITSADSPPTRRAKMKAGKSFRLKSVTPANAKKTGDGGDESPDL
jgi:hypothetical protein